jgi:hypothetical protein
MEKTDQLDVRTGTPRWSEGLGRISFEFRKPTSLSARVDLSAHRSQCATLSAHDGQCATIPVALVPPDQRTPFASQYIERSTTIGMPFVTRTMAPNAVPRSSSMSEASSV